MTGKSHGCVLELQSQNNEGRRSLHLNFKCNPETLNSHYFLLISGDVILMHYKLTVNIHLTHRPSIRGFHM